MATTNELATTNTAEELLTTLVELEDRDERFQARFEEPTPEMVELSEELSFER
jgi:hypothetical protein